MGLLKTLLLLAIAFASSVYGQTAATATATSTPSGSISTPKPSPKVQRAGGLAVRSGSAIQYLAVNANSQQLWLNKNTTTYCPTDTTSCSNDPNPQTVFIGTGQTETLVLDVTVPGGQQVYVTGEGLLKFTQAHSANTEPGSRIDRFDWVGYEVLEFEGQSWYACPTTAEDGKVAYSIWAASRYSSHYGADCLGFEIRAQTPEHEVHRVYQYV